MSKILYQTTANNYLFPGLPYQDHFKRVHPVIYSGIPSEAELEVILSRADRDTLVNPWTLDVLRGFQTYIPTTYNRVVHNLAPNIVDLIDGKKESPIPEHLRVLLQLQTEIETKGATIDAAIIHGRRDLGTVVNKAHVLNRIYVIGSRYGYIKEREGAPFRFDQYGDLRNPAVWDRVLSDMKMLFVEFAKEVPIGTRKYDIQTRRVDVSQRQLARKYVHVEWLKQKLKGHLVGILLYGSAARTDDPDKYSDFDNWVRVKDVQQAHRVLQGICPVVIDGKVVELRGKANHDIPGAKHIGIHLLPASDKFLYRHTRFLHDPIEFFLHTRVLLGEFPMPVISQDEVAERGMSQAHIKLKTIAASLNWAYHDPQRLMDRSALFEFVVKNMRFFYQHALNAIEKPDFRSKDAVDARLAEFGLKVPKFKRDPQYIKQSLLYAMVGALRLQQWYMRQNRRPNFEFLTGGGHFPAGKIVDLSTDWAKFDGAE